MDLQLFLRNNQCYYTIADAIYPQSVSVFPLRIDVINTDFICNNTSRNVLAYKVKVGNDYPRFDIDWVSVGSC